MHFVKKISIRKQLRKYNQLRIFTKLPLQKNEPWAGSVGRTLSSDTGCTQFESSHRQILFTLNCV